MKNVTEKELAQILFDTELVKGMPTFASVLQMTEPKCLVKSRINKEIKNPYSEILKVSKVSIILNSEYEKAVTNQLGREDKEASDYKKGVNTMPITFGERNNFVGLFNGEFVIQYRPNDSVIPQTKYFADGVETSKKELVDFLPAANKATNQGTDRIIEWRKLYLKNILEITLNRESYKVIR